MGITFKKIKKDIAERLSHYTHSMQPTEDEVSIAWLVSEIESGCGCPIGEESCLKYKQGIGTCRIKEVGAEQATDEIVKEVLEGLRQCRRYQS